MPIYEYRCATCGHELEVIQKFSDAPLVDCPACNEAALKKLLSPTAFRLSGTGWYETDFKSGNKKNIAADDKGNSGKAESPKGGAAKTDASNAPGAKTDSASGNTGKKPGDSGKAPAPAG